MAWWNFYKLVCLISFYWHNTKNYLSKIMPRFSVLKSDTLVFSSASPFQIFYKSCCFIKIFAKCRKETYFTNMINVWFTRSGELIDPKLVGLVQ